MRHFPCCIGETGPGGPEGILARSDFVRPALEKMRRRDWDGLRKDLSLRSARAEPETVRVLALRVDFSADSAGPGSSTQDGGFDLRSNDEAKAAIDPPPHDKAYFESHMEALRRYYWAQSGGRIFVQADVFPAGSDSAYHLADTADYGPWIISNEDTDLIAIAERFITDALMTADAEDPAVDFSRYQSIIVFHAGGDLQGDINRDSPYDIPSFNLFFGEPLMVEDSTVAVDIVMVVPETVSQDGFLGGLNGVVTHEFGHQLGFFDVYDVRTFLPVVGMFSLMDSGDNTFGTVFDPFSEQFVFVRGALPASIDPWHKYLFFGAGEGFGGGVSVRQLNSPREETFGASVVEDEILLLPINLQEWYLIENRPYDLNGDGSVILRADSLTGVILGPDHDDGMDGDSLATMEYDFLLPGAGALVWHIDWQAIVDGLQTIGGINALRDRKGVRVVEADGIPDLGDVFSPEWTGGPFDYWFEGGRTRLASDTDPATDSSHGTPSFLSLEFLGPPGLQMGLRWSRGWTRARFPSLATRRGSFGRGGILAVDLIPESGFPGLEILSGTGEGLTLWTSGGERYGLGVTDGDSTMWALAAGDIRGALSWNPDYAWGDGETGAFAAITGEGRLNVWRAFGSGPDLVWPDPISAEATPRIVATDPVVLDSVIVVGGDDGRIRGLVPGSTPELVWRIDPAAGPIAEVGAGDLNEDGDMEFFWVTVGGQVGWTSGPQRGPLSLDDGWTRTDDPEVPMADIVGAAGRPDYGPKADPGGLWTLDVKGRLSRWPLIEGTPSTERDVQLDLGGEPAGDIVLGDLDGDNQIEVVVAMASGTVHVRSADGGAEDFWPADVRAPDDDADAGIKGSTLLVPPVEGQAGFLMIPRPRGELAVLDQRGRHAAGWPQTLGNDIDGSLWLGDLDEDGDLEVVAGDVLGYVTVLDPPLAANVGPGSWTVPGASTWRGRFLSGDRIPEPKPVSQPLVDGIPKIYPNPVRGPEAILNVPLRGPARVRLEALSSSGQTVGRWEWQALGGPDGDRLPFPVDGLAPGFFLCRIHVEGASDAYSTLQKLAVVR